MAEKPRRSRRQWRGAGLLACVAMIGVAPPLAEPAPPASPAAVDPWAERRAEIRAWLADPSLPMPEFPPAYPQGDELPPPAPPTEAELAEMARRRALFAPIYGFSAKPEYRLPPGGGDPGRPFDPALGLPATIPPAGRR